MRKGTYQLHITGFDWDGYTGTVIGEDGKPVYNVLDKIDPDKNQENIMTDKILAVDDVSIRKQTYKAEPLYRKDKQGNVYAFDLDFTITLDGEKKSSVVIRLSEPQAKKLNEALDNRYVD
jgi:hypothetical protein